MSFEGGKYIEQSFNDKMCFKITFRYEYELIVVPGLVLNDSITPVIRTKVKEPPVMINPDDLGGSTAAGKTFTMGVRLKSAKVSIKFIS